MNTTPTALEQKFPTPAIPVSLPVLAAPLPAPKPPPTVTAADVSSVIGKVDTLSAEEAALLQAYESTIKKSWKATLDRGTALAGIRDKQLYRIDSTSFDDYYRVRWGFSCKSVYVWITAAELFAVITSRPDLPAPDHESQLRPMFGLTGPQAQLAWQSAAVISRGYPITARIVKRAVRELQLKQKPAQTAATRVNKTQQRKVLSDAVGELVVLITQKAAYDVLLMKVEALDREMRALFAPAKLRKP